MFGKLRLRSDIAMIRLVHHGKSGQKRTVPDGTGGTGEKTKQPGRFNDLRVLFASLLDFAVLVAGHSEKDLRLCNIEHPEMALCISVSLIAKPRFSNLLQEKALCSPAERFSGQHLQKAGGARLTLSGRVLLTRLPPSPLSDCLR
jgi:hypothetical protein